MAFPLKTPCLLLCLPSSVLPARCHSSDALPWAEEANPSSRHCSEQPAKRCSTALDKGKLTSRCAGSWWVPRAQGQRQEDCHEVKASWTTSRTSSQKTKIKHKGTYKKARPGASLGSPYTSFDPHMLQRGGRKAVKWAGRPLPPLPRICRHLEQSDQVTSHIWGKNKCNYPQANRGARSEGVLVCTVLKSQLIFQSRCYII